MSEKKVTVVAIIKAKPGLESRVEQELTALVLPTRAEADCINYHLHRDGKDPSVFMFYENWVSRASLDEHLQKPHLKAFLEKADELLAAPLDVQLYEMISCACNKGCDDTTADLGAQALKAAFIFVAPETDSAKHRAVVETPVVKLTVVGVKDYQEAATVAKTLVDEGTVAIELCGGFGHKGVAAVGEAVKGNAAVGVVRFDNHPGLGGKSGDEIF
jgi:quinol monooxygenase YgiN